MLRLVCASEFKYPHMRWLFGRRAANANYFNLLRPYRNMPFNKSQRRPQTEYNSGRQVFLPGGEKSDRHEKNINQTVDGAAVALVISLYYYVFHAIRLADLWNRMPRSGN